MPVDNPDTVDIISVEKTTGCVVLTISDHLEWSDSKNHQLILQTKMNKYLAFIESGELREKYPNAKGRRVVIAIASKHKPDVEGFEFLKKAKSIIEAAGFDFRFELFSGASPFIN